MDSLKISSTMNSINSATLIFMVIFVVASTGFVNGKNKGFSGKF